jgi:hypothetical protein
VCSQSVPFRPLFASRGFSQHTLCPYHVGRRRRNCGEMFNSDMSSGFQLDGSLTPLGNTDDIFSLLQSTAKAQALSATANPADLSVLRNINMSPSSSESSPSPPNHTQSGQTATGSGADHDTDQAALADDIFSNITMASRATRSANRDSQTGEPSAKRKLLDDLDEDSDEDAPQRKLQHTDPSSEHYF